MSEAGARGKIYSQSLCRKPYLCALKRQKRIGRHLTRHRAHSYVTVLQVSASLISVKQSSEKRGFEAGYSHRVLAALAVQKLGGTPTDYLVPVYGDQFLLIIG
jgi:hypothetical protein